MSVGALLKNEISAISANVFYYVTNLVVTAIITNSISPNDYSIFVLAFYTLRLVRPIIMRGANQLLFSYFDTYITESTDTDTDSLLSWELRCAFYGSVVYLAVVLAVFFGFYFFDAAALSKEFYTIIGCLMLAPLYIWMQVQGELLLTLQKYTSYYIVYTCLPYVVIGLCLCGFMFVHGSLTLLFVVLAYAIGYTVVALIESFVIRSISGWQSVSQIWGEDTKNSQAGSWRDASVGYLINTILQKVIGTLPVYLLTWFASDSSASGVYNVIITIVSLLWLLNTSMDSILVSNVSTNITTTKGITTLQSLLNSLNLLQCIVGIIMVAVFVFFSADILSLYGQQYTTASSILITYACINFFTIFFSNGMTILNYSNNINANIVINIIGLLFLAVLGTIAAYKFGLTGVLVIYACTTLLTGIVSSVYAHYKYGIKVVSLI